MRTTSRTRYLNSIDRVVERLSETIANVGSYLGLDDAHDLMLRQILLDDRVAPRDAPILHEYLNDPEITPEEALETVIHIPVQ